MSYIKAGSVFASDYNEAIKNAKDVFGSSAFPTDIIGKAHVGSGGNEYNVIIENPEDYISFGDFARNVLGQQCQYASYYVTETPGYENLGIGLRFKNLNTGSYHDILIHKDDTDTFRKRYEQHKKELLQ